MAPLDAEIAQVEEELRAEFKRLQSEARAHIAEMRTENNSLLVELRAADESLLRIRSAEIQLAKEGSTVRVWFLQHARLTKRYRRNQISNANERYTSPGYSYLDVLTERICFCAWFSFTHR